MRINKPDENNMATIDGFLNPVKDEKPLETSDDTLNRVLILMLTGKTGEPVQKVLTVKEFIDNFNTLCLMNEEANKTIRSLLIHLYLADKNHPYFKHCDPKLVEFAQMASLDVAISEMEGEKNDDRNLS